MSDRAATSGSAAWVARAQIAVCALTGLACVALPTPEPFGSTGSAWRTITQIAGALLAAAILIPAFRARTSRSIRPWLIAAVAVGGVLFATVGFYSTKADDWTCDYAETRVIVGDEFVSDPDTADYLAKHSALNCEDLIRNFAGKVEEIWTRGSIDSRRRRLTLAFVAVPGLAEGFLILLLQAIALSRAPVTLAAPPRLGARVFISYRKSDTAGIVDRLCERLEQRLQPGHLFRDIQSIDVGQDFTQAIRNAVAQCDVLLAVIGPSWLTAETSSGERRLDDPTDWVRVEIETALQRDVLVVPIAYKTTFPAPDRLPQSLERLGSLQGLLVRDDPDFPHDVERLLAAIADAVASRSAASTSSEAAPSVDSESQA